MLQATHLLFCDHCSSATDRCERGWRAYTPRNDRGDVTVEIVCPVCAEWLGEDESALD